MNFFKQITDLFLTKPKRSENYWYSEYIRLEKEYRALHLLFNDEELRNGFVEKLTIKNLEHKISTLKHELRKSQCALEDRNRQIKALGYITYCTGCWPGGPDNKETLTDEDVREVQHIAGRLRTWFDNMESRRKNGTLWK